MTRTVAVQVLDGGQVAVLGLRGEVDLAVDDDLRTAVARMLSSGVRGMVVDLSQLAFTDCTGINALAVLSVRAAADGRPVVLAAAPPLLVRLLKLLDLYPRFRHEATMAAALDMARELVAQADGTRLGAPVPVDDPASPR